MTTEVSVRDSLSFNYSPDFCFFLKHFSHWFNCIVTIHIQSKFRWEESLSRNEISIENVCLFRKYFFPWASEAYTLTFPASLIAAMILTWSSMRSLPKEQMTTSTCLMALTRLWWSFMSPWREKGVVWLMVWKEKMVRKRGREKGRTWIRKTPAFWKFWRSSSLVSGFAAVTSLGLLTVGGVSLTNTYVGFPAFTLAHTMCLPMAPVGPKTRILSFPAMRRDDTENKHLALCGFLVLIAK